MGEVRACHQSDVDIPLIYLSTNTTSNHEPEQKHNTLPPPAARRPPPPSLTMPASDYTSTISGGLKLKGGAKDAGVKKKSKKSKSSSKDKAAPKPSTPQDGEEAGDSKDSNTNLALSTTHSDRDATPSDQQPSSSGTGKTEAQRRHEEIKRKRVSYTTKHTRFATSSNKKC